MQDSKEVLSMVTGKPRDQEKAVEHYGVRQRAFCGVGLNSDTLHTLMLDGLNAIESGQ